LLFLRLVGLLRSVGFLRIMGFLRKRRCYQNGGEKNEESEDEYPRNCFGHVGAFPLLRIESWVARIIADAVGFQYELIVKVRTRLRRLFHSGIHDAWTYIWPRIKTAN
jgi:hypothetical protein